MLLKQAPDDFLVREHALLDLKEGPYSTYLLRKREWNTEDILQAISKKLGIPRKQIGSCGNKDKQAITEQFITVQRGPQSVSLGQDVMLTYLGTRAEALHMGAHERNFFTITVRDVTKQPKAQPVKNYFGEQRFGENNLDVGLALLKKDYKGAAQLLHATITTDAISAIRTVPKHTLMLYVHAVQSQLWNELVQTLPAVQDEVPIIGFGPGGNESLLPLYEPLMQKYDLTHESWINRSLSELSVEGGSRPLLQDLKDFSASKIKDDVCIVSFSLGKGSYATETIKQVFSDP